MIQRCWKREETSSLLLELHHSPSRNQQVSFESPSSASSHCASSPTALSSQFPLTQHTQSWRAHGCIHLPLSHHNTLFKLDTARSLFFLAELIEPVQPDLPYQSVKGIFHSLQYKTQLPSVLGNTEGHTVWVHELQLTKERSRPMFWGGSTCLVCPTSSATWADTPPVIRLLWIIPNSHLSFISKRGNVAGTSANVHKFLWKRAVSKLAKK